MPKFDSLFPNTPEDEPRRVDGVGEVSRTGGDGYLCMGCLEFTPWIESNAMGFICSTECSEAFWSDADLRSEAAVELADDPGF